MALKGQNMGNVKQSNRSAILYMLHQQGGMSRKQMAEKLHLTPAAVTILVSEMIEDGILYEGEAIESCGNVGRKEIRIDIRKDCIYFFGMYFGLEKVIISAADPQGNLLHTANFALNEKHSSEKKLLGATQKMLEIAKLPVLQGRRCAGIGVSIRGIVNSRTGISINSFGVLDNYDVRVRDIIQEAVSTVLPVDVFFDNNVRSMAQAYVFTDIQEQVESMLFVRNETGIGSALILQHKLYSGYRNKAAEIGHTVVDRHGRMCQCGQRGCLETVASSRSIVRNVKEIYGAESTPYLYKATGGAAEKVTIGKIQKSAEAGDERCAKIMDSAVEALATVLRWDMDVLDVQRLVLHGKIFENKAFFEQIIRQMNFDGKYQNPESFILTTADYRDIDRKGAPILAIKNFYDCGGAVRTAENKE